MTTRRFSGAEIFAVLVSLASVAISVIGNRTQVKYVGTRWLEWSGVPEAAGPSGKPVGNYWSDHVAFDIDGDGMPFTVSGTGSVAGGEVRIDASSSSQFVSGLLLAGATFRDGLTVIHTGETVPSQPHIEMTITMLREAGVVVDDGELNRWHVASGPITARHWAIEPDLSNSVPFLAAAAMMLEALQGSGDVAVAERRGAVRVWDLASRILPEVGALGRGGGHGPHHGAGRSGLPYPSRT